jgi:hypothetical protein
MLRQHASCACEGVSPENEPTLPSPPPPPHASQYPELEWFHTGHGGAGIGGTTGGAPRLSRPTATSPLASVRTQRCVTAEDEFSSRRPCWPSGSWSTAIASALVRIALDAALMLRGSSAGGAGAKKKN